MTGTFINIATILAGSLLGIAFHSKLPERFIKIVFQGLGLFTLFLGVKMALQANEILLMVFSIVLGGITGELLSLESNMEQASEWVKKRLKLKNEKFSEGAVTASILFCVGSMAILGSIEEGLGKSPDLLITKAVMDGFAAIALASAFGVGVAFSVVPLLFYQGGITILAFVIRDYLSQPLVNELSAVGGLMIMGIGISLLDLKKIKVLNLLPALIYSILFTLVFVLHREMIFGWFHF